MNVRLCRVVYALRPYGFPNKGEVVLGPIRLSADDHTGNHGRNTYRVVVLKIAQQVLIDEADGPVRFKLPIFLEKTPVMECRRVGNAHSHLSKPGSVPGHSMPFDEISTLIDTLDSAVNELALVLMSGEMLDHLRKDVLVVTVYKIDDVSSLLSRRIASRPQLQRVLGDGPVSTWDHLVLDYSPFKIPMSVRARAKAENLRLLLAAEEVPEPAGLSAVLPADSPFAQSSRLVRRAYAEYFARNAGDAIALLGQAVRANPRDRAAGSMFRVMRSQIAAANAKQTQ